MTGLIRTTISAGTPIALALALTGCASYRLPPDTKPWQNAVNVCYSHYNHVWSAVPFVSEKAEARVVIVVPESWMTTKANEGDILTHSDEGHMDTTEAKGNIAVDEDKTSAETTSDNAGINLSEQAASIVEKQAKAYQTEKKKKTDSLTISQATKIKEREDQSNQIEEDASTKSETSAKEGIQNDRDALSMLISDDKSSSANSREGFSRSKSRDKKGSSATKDAEATQAEEELFSHSRSDEASANIVSDSNKADMTAHEKNSSSESDAFSGTITEESNNAFMKSGEMWPALSLSKKAGMPVVLAGWEFDYTIRLINTGPLALHSIRVKDNHPKHATFIGIKYRWYEFIFPFMRKIKQSGPEEFQIKKGLAPGQKQQFRLIYRAHVPERTNIQIEKIDY